VDTNVVTRFDQGPEDVYLIGADQQLAAAYYRNTIVHFFLYLSIAELAVLKACEHDVEQPVDAFWAEAMSLRDLLKFEFFFEDKDAYRNRLAKELFIHDQSWESRLEAGEGASMVRHFRPFTSHRVLRPFLESYRVVADNLNRMGSEAVLEDEPFLESCLALGRQYQLQRRIGNSASVSKVLFSSALKLARNRNLVEPAVEVEVAREAFALELQDVIRRIDGIAALAASRQAGMIS